jgi:selenocysteine lyase/cysteine desulfurase
VTFEEARAQFPVLERLAYLNAGTNGPLSRATAVAMEAQGRIDLEEGRGGHAYFEQALELRDEVRAKLAAFVEVDPENLTLATSTTNGCNMVVAGLGLGPEDEVLTTDGEHFGLLGALAVAQVRLRVARVRELPPEQALQALLAEVTPKTRLLALSHVCWMTGNRFPVAELKEQTGLPILIDGAQSVGAIPVDASRFDYYAFSCQKWLCGPDSMGGLTLAEPDSLPLTAPSYFAQQSHDEEGGFELRPGAARFDPGWTPASALAGLAAALDSRPDWAFERAAETTARCRELLAERVDVVTAGEPATLVTFRVEEDSAEVVERLYEQGVVVRDIPGQGFIRVSCGWWTSDEDLERLLVAL